jgi:hypothetical protein
VPQPPDAPQAIEYTQVPAFAAFWAAVTACWHWLLGLSDPMLVEFESPSLMRTITFVAPGRALAIRAL